MTGVSIADKVVSSTAPALLAKVMPSHGCPGTDTKSEAGGPHAAPGSCPTLPSCGSDAGAGGSCSLRWAAPAQALDFWPKLCLR